MQAKDSNPKKHTVKKIEFSLYGDKFVSMNAEGTIFMSSFDNTLDTATVW